jgi:C4-dicarboxylate transporter DctM subunit
LIITAAMLFGFTLSDAYATQSMAEFLMGLNLGKWGIFIIINLFMLVLGAFLPPVAVVLLVITIVQPVIVNLGFNPIWFAVITMLVMQITLCLPTSGLSLLIVKRKLPEVSMIQLFKACFPFLGTILLAIVILCIFPQIALWLPNIVFPN